MATLVGLIQPDGKTAELTMDLVDIVNADAVRVGHGISSKKRLFQSVAQIIASEYSMDADEILQALQEREGLGATGVGRGVALPHARLEKLDRIVGCFIKLDKAIDFDAVDRQPVDLIFVLIAPQDSGVAHLRALASVSRTLRDPGVCDKLRCNDDANTLFEVLLEGPASQAA